MKIFIIIDLVLMVLLAFLLAEWNGIFIVEGILAGAGIAVGALLDKKRNEKREKKK